MSKYHNKSVMIGDLRFASQAEARRWNELSLLVVGKRVTALRCQPRFPLVVNGQTVCTYVGDFYYREGGKECVEDVKGFETEAFKLKAKLFRALHPTIELRIIPAGSGRRISRRSGLRRTGKLGAAVSRSMPL